MIVHDVTLPIYTGMPVYKNKPEKQPAFETVTNGHVTETRISLDAHTGTHIDAPLHMDPNGATIETIPIEDLVTPVRLFDLTAVEDGIDAQDLEPLGIQAGEFVLFKTKNSFDEAFNFNFIYLKESAARYLASIGIKGVGIDGLGVERSQPEHPTHRLLFDRGIIVIEGLKLDQVAPGRYLMVAAPLKVRGIDAAPARILLLEESSSRRG